MAGVVLVTAPPLPLGVLAGKIPSTREFPVKRLGFPGVWPGGPFGCTNGAAKFAGCEFLDFHARDHHTAGISRVESAHVPDV